MPFLGLRDDTVPPPYAPVEHLAATTPTRDQAVVLYVIGVYFVVIFALWNLPGARHLINPLKLFTIGWHETCHIVVAILTGGRILRVTIDPDLGGCTLVEGGHAPAVLAAGYAGSALLGGALVTAGWDTLAAKVASLLLAIGLVCPLVLVRDKLTIVLTFCYEALLVGFWFADHGAALRFYCLFVGVMNVFYAVWDVADDRFFQKANDSDATQFAILCPRVPAHVWALIWFAFDAAVLVGFVLLGISQFKMTPDQMRAQAAHFLPT